MSFIRLCRGDLEKQLIYKNNEIKSKKLCSFVELICSLSCKKRLALITFHVNFFILLEKKLGVDGKRDKCEMFVAGQTALHVINSTKLQSFFDLITLFLYVSTADW